MLMLLSVIANSITKGNWCCGTIQPLEAALISMSTFSISSNRSPLTLLPISLPFLLILTDNTLTELLKKYKSLTLLHRTQPSMISKLSPLLLTLTLSVPLNKSLSPLILSTLMLSQVAQIFTCSCLETMESGLPAVQLSTTPLMTATWRLIMQQEPTF